MSVFRWLPDFPAVTREGEIGSGTSAVVYRATWRWPGGAPASGALKLYRTFGEQFTREQFFRELEVSPFVSNPGHPAVLRTFAVSLNPPQCLTELGLCDLAFVLERERGGRPRGRALAPDLPWGDAKASIALLGIADGMRHVHAHRVLHRDLKPGNVVLDADAYPRITDFGMGRAAGLSATLGVGTPLYMAPEALCSDGSSFPCDVYSFAMIAYELATGRAPFAERGALALGALTRIVEAGARPELRGAEGAGELAELIRDCWAPCPAARPTFEAVVERIVETPIVVGACDPRGPEYQAYCRRLGLDACTRGRSCDWD
jgi:serine/threonine protein kinase